MDDTNHLTSSSGNGRVHAVIHALVHSFPVYILTSAVVFVGAAFGQNYISMGEHRDAKETDMIGCFAAWDGVHYLRIAEQGYSNNPKRPSNVAFFPAFPLAGRLVVAITGWRTDFALLFVSHVFLIGAFAALALYTRHRFGGEPSAPAGAMLLAFGLFPTTFWLRMAYTESLFVFLVILTLYGVARRWPLWTLAAIVGLATATRASGVALLVPLAFDLWGRSASFRIWLLRSLVVLPMACWGLAAYMLFQFLAFGDALAFMKTQQHWDQRPAVPLFEKLYLELQLEPLVCAYDPACHCHRLHDGRDPSPLFSMYFANPIYFLAFVYLVVFGGLKNWLNRNEVLTCVALLLFSYLTKSYATCMCSQARYASTVFPVYLVLGQFLHRIPGPIVTAILAVWSVFLGIYSALFVRWHDLY